MGVRLPSAATNTFIGPLPASAAETIVCTTPPLSLPLDSAQVFLLWFWSAIVGASSTFSQFNIRRGTSLTSPIVNAGIVAIANTAANGIFASGTYFDLPGAAADIQYTLTVQQGAATAAGTFRDCALIAYCL
jgi:hypothetical protein